MLPRRAATIRGQTACEKMNAACKVTSTSRRQFSKVTSAMLTSFSTAASWMKARGLGYEARAPATASWVAAASARSTSNGSTSLPARVSSAASDFSLPAWMSNRASRSPAAASSLAISRPSPSAAPVRNTTLSSGWLIRSPASLTDGSGDIPDHGHDLAGSLDAGQRRAQQSEGIPVVGRDELFQDAAGYGIEGLADYRSALDDRSEPAPPDPRPVDPGRGRGQGYLVAAHDRRVAKFADRRHDPGPAEGMPQSLRDVLGPVLFPFAAAAHLNPDSGRALRPGVTGQAGAAIGPVKDQRRAHPGRQLVTAGEPVGEAVDVPAPAAVHIRDDVRAVEHVLGEHRRQPLSMRTARGAGKRIVQADQVKFGRRAVGRHGQRMGHRDDPERADELVPGSPGDQAVNRQGSPRALVPVHAGGHHADRPPAADFADVDRDAAGCQPGRDVVGLPADHFSESFSSHVIRPPGR